MSINEGEELVAMPGSCDRSPEVRGEEMACTVLNRFIGIPEQTYENFLTAFTYHPQAELHSHHVTWDSFPHPLEMRKAQRDSKREDCQIRTDDLENDCPDCEKKSPDRIAHGGEGEDLEQLIIGEGENVGCCHSLTRAGRVQVDNFLSTSDMNPNSDDEETGSHLLLYPGEADPEVVNDDKAIVRSTCLDIQTSFSQQITPEEHLDDDIQPFALDQSFDYDRVALTPKFSAVELDFLKDRGHQKAEDEVTEEQNPTHS
ncbi:intraflagellar transport-associated protein [Mantella aurantiaca]